VTNNHPPSAALLFLVPSLIWGSTWLAIKYQLGIVAAEVSVVYRFAAAGLLLLAWCAATHKPLLFSQRDHAFLALQGALMFGFNYAAVYLAEERLTSGLVAVLFSTIVFMNPVGLRLVHDTPVSLRMLVAAALGVAGVALLFLPELLAAGQGGDAGIGIAYGLGATALASAGNLVAMRNQRVGIPTFPGTAWGMLYGAAAAAAWALARHSPWAIDTRPAYWLSFAYLVLVGSIVAFGAYLTLLKRVGAGPSAFVAVATPVIALVLSTLFEGYRWTGVAVVGVVLAVIGNVLAMPAWARWRARIRTGRGG